MTKWHTSITRIAVAVAVATVAIIGTATVADAQPAPTAVTVGTTPALTPVSTVFGCRAGWVCLYTDHTNVLSASHPHTDYFNYGFDNFSNVTGLHWIVNNQTGGAPVFLCRSFGGTNCPAFADADGVKHAYLPAGFATILNMTPINSIRLCPAVNGCQH